MDRVQAVVCLTQSTATGASMKTLIDFLSLRPIWTRRGLEMVWYAYLLGTLLHLGWLFNFLFSANVTVSSGYGFSLIYSTLFALAQLALVRIFLELALKFLITTREEAYAPRP
jgi:hypothetical protein